MKWIIGVDLRPKSQGALTFARFLHDASPTDEFVAVHVVPHDHLMAALRYHHLDEVMKAAQEAAQKVVDETGCTDVCGQVVVEKGGASVHGTLLEIAEREGADGILVGRQATREGHDIVRLGSVARRLLRDTDRPVAVVPPDLQLADVGTGPVLFLSRLADDSVPAGTMAKTLADHLGRKLVLAHAIPVPQDWGSHYLPGAVLDKLREEHRAEAEERMRAWAADHGLEGVAFELLEGSILDVVPGAAERLDACLVVVGSRRLSMGERWLLTSASSHLAGQLDRPVLVVPTTE
ncbi:MAG: universal stress protein [Deltaproteobacteria bacterium]|nr:MAG: universal stress protein [Deltaproteobacteria bacterium]